MYQGWPLERGCIWKVKLRVYHGKFEQQIYSRNQVATYAREVF